MGRMTGECSLLGIEIEKSSWRSISMLKPEMCKAVRHWKLREPASSRGFPGVKT